MRRKMRETRAEPDWGGNDVISEAEAVRLS